MSACIPTSSIALSKIGIDWVCNAQAAHNSWTSAFGARIAVVALAVFTATDASLHLALATTKLPFAAVKLGVDCFTAKPVMDALGFKEIERHLYKVIQCIRILVLEMGWLFVQPEDAAGLYALRGVYQKPSESIKERLWRQLALQTAMFHRPFRYLADRPHLIGAVALLIVGGGLLYRYGLPLVSLSNQGGASTASILPDTQKAAIPAEKNVSHSESSIEENTTYERDVFELPDNQGDNTSAGTAGAAMLRRSLERTPSKQSFTSVNDWMNPGVVGLFGLPVAAIFSLASLKSKAASKQRDAFESSLQNIKDEPEALAVLSFLNGLSPGARQALWKKMTAKGTDVGDAFQVLNFLQEQFLLAQSAAMVPLDEADEAERKQDNAQYKEQLAAKYERVTCQGNGNCMYEAFARGLGLAHPETAADGLRKKLYQYMHDNADQLRREDSSLGGFGGLSIAAFEKVREAAKARAPGDSDDHRSAWADLRHARVLGLSLKARVYVHVFFGQDKDQVVPLNADVFDGPEIHLFWSVRHFDYMKPIHASLP